MSAAEKETEMHLVWLDMEMTGLDPEHDRILEIATLITDKDLNLVAEGPELVIFQPEEVLSAMDDWNTRHHTDSGLLQRVQREGISLAEAEEKTLDFIARHVPPKTAPLCGNSIAQDRRFLFRYMAKLEAFLHYRNLDVSSLKELAKRWRPDLMQGLAKSGKHRAMEDVRESVAELRYYREHFLHAQPPDKNGR